MSYTAMELMICCAARCLEDGKTVAVGTGVPCAAAMLAQRTAVAEPGHLLRGRRRGARSCRPCPSASAIRAPSTAALMATSMADVMETCQRGMMDYTFLGGAQIDAFGNLNSTMIGDDYAKPEGASARQRRGQRPGLACAGASWWSPTTTAGASSRSSIS